MKSLFFVLGMIERLGDLVDTARDSIGLRLEDERLPQRVRMPWRKKREVTSVE